MYHASIISINIIWNPRKNTPLIPGATRCGLPILPENESSLYVTLLSFILALALTAALAACGSDEPSGGNGPDRTASTPTDTPAAPTRTLATPRAGTASTATDAPGPAAATAPPAASGSVETDREALVALYNATDGENWDASANWLSDAPLGEWHGVTTNADGRVIGLDFFSNGLSGEIPAELGSLANLTYLNLSNNALSGCVPSSLEDRLNFDYSDLGGLPFC